MLALVLLFAQAFFGQPGVAEWHPSTAAVDPVLTFGDSKTSAGRYQSFARQRLEFTHPIRLDILAAGGRTAAVWAPLVDAEIAAIGENGYRFILFNLGANDVVALPDQATWLADAGYIVDAFHARWPTASVLVMRPWRKDEDADCDSLAGYIAALVSTRSEWAVLGPDERAFLKSSDNGATYCPDGTHPNYLGYIATADQWISSMQGHGF